VPLAESPVSSAADTPHHVDWLKRAVFCIALAVLVYLLSFGPVTVFGSRIKNKGRSIWGAYPYFGQNGVYALIWLPAGNCPTYARFLEKYLDLWGVVLMQGECPWT